MALFKCGNDKAYTETFGSKYNTDRGYSGTPSDSWVTSFTGYYTLAKKGKVKSVTFGSEQLYIGGSGQGKMWFGFTSHPSTYPCKLYGSNDNSNWTLIQEGIVMGRTTTITTSTKYKYLRVDATGPNYSKWVEGAGNYWACAIPTFTVNYRG